MVRGYDNFSLGTYTQGAYLGGNAMTVFNTELKVKLAPQFALVGFFDAGNAWEDLDRANMSDLKKGVGAGIRYEIPLMGVMGFDAGFGLDYEFSEESTFWDKVSQSFRPHFQLSSSF
ncbi:BamA/TamA family outer membrane protein [candidate division WOR-3 bacterium]|uniref:BamA/TamA family outer membrane protein n=1 Tax=candidate division WOR-3 bacterium TaxID=2052148 RepID=A0A9D5K9P0_UNCW3|nr:BamA/TamA family outer membrane protein [candidate division WOR-3 bacterium]MBD3364174.1 BamA/TamA family outer membrane protein [candidate division WOR-3 bacterium]